MKLRGNNTVQEEKRDIGRLAMGHMGKPFLRPFLERKNNIGDGEKQNVGSN